jgi:hypothetical protein
MLWNDKVSADTRGNHAPARADGAPPSDAGANGGAERALVEWVAGSTHRRPAAPRSAGGPAKPAPHEDAWAQLWFTLERHAWTTLAIVPVDEHASALGAARALVEAGQLYREGAVELLDATGTTPEMIEQVADATPERTLRGLKVVIAVGSPLVYPAAIAIARAADAALLAVPLGQATKAAGHRTIESIGREHFIGSIAMRGAQE